MRGRLLVALLLAAVGGGARADEPPSETALEALTPHALVRRYATAGAVAQARVEAELRRRGVRMVHVVRTGAARMTGTTRKGLLRVAELLVRDHHRRHQPPGMIYVPAGPLEVPRDATPYGASGTRVDVPAFYLDRTEVTVGAWRRWIAHLATTEPEGERPDMPDPELPASHPITQISWREADRFARVYREGRLPRTEELERAVRGSGLATWPWGEVYRTGKARLGLSPDDTPLPVGSFPDVTGPFGALDLVGNVAEWTATTRQAGRAFRSKKALLFGGSYRDPPSPGLTWRSPRKSAALDRERRAWIGFRVARDVPGIPPPEAD